MLYFFDISWLNCSFKVQNWLTLKFCTFILLLIYFLDFALTLWPPCWEMFACFIIWLNMMASCSSACRFNKKTLKVEELCIKMLPIPHPLWNLIPNLLSYWLIVCRYEISANMRAGSVCKSTMSGTGQKICVRVWWWWVGGVNL